ncbi:MAG: 50S ribosomal protein L13 [Bacteroidetes bacterium]|nr:MAG: 50S ribosomal protein L13 [Bacteroidota bacterium]
MDQLSYKTQYVNSVTADKNWVVVDAADAVLGRLSSQVAKILQGKHKVNYTPNVDCGDNVIVINAAKVKLTGKKWTNKVYVRHTGYPGGQRFATPRQIATKKSYSILIEMAVRRMLPKNKLGSRMFTNLKVYDDATHNHEAQQPSPIQLDI